MFNVQELKRLRDLNKMITILIQNCQDEDVTDETKFNLCQVTSEKAKLVHLLLNGKEQKK